ncbi:hypothetical protein U9M48_019591 [Paspalum notatum var. saurae]|uniref:Uncharacterized protein n=1 Tax=Paspalum notatum var. saurae TaxID=547442 RepID=A0AAQ3WR41_PASNO
MVKKIVVISIGPKIFQTESINILGYWPGLHSRWFVAVFHRLCTCTQRIMLTWYRVHSCTSNRRIAGINSLFKNIFMMSKEENMRQQ